MKLYHKGNFIFYLLGLWAVKEICPVWVRLHVAEDEELTQQQLQDDQGDVVTGLLVLNFGTLKKEGFIAT